MQGMSSYQKFLYIMCIIGIVVGIAYALLGVWSLASGELASGMTEAAAGTGLSTADLVTMQGWSLIVLGAIQALVSLMGFVGTRNPAKLGPFAVIMYIYAIISLVGIVANIATGNFSWETFTSLIPIIMAYAAYTVRKEYKANNQ